MKIFLTGACGYVGSALLPKLLEAGHYVTAIDTCWFASDPRVQVADVRGVQDLNGADLVLILAAIANDPSVSCYPRRSWETGVLATQQLAQLAARTGARLLYASSVSVYGADRGMVTEDMEPHPLSDYNKTKIVAERVLLSYAKRCPVQIVRPATICGLAPRMRLDLTVNLFTMQALCKGEITLHGGQQWRPSIHIDDMCALYLWLIDHPEVAGIYNAGFENNNLLSIAEKVRAATGAHVKLQHLYDARSYQVDSSKLLAAGFQPQKSVDDAIGELIAAYQAGTLKDDPRWHNLNFMRYLEIRDE